MGLSYVPVTRNVMGLFFMYSYPFSIMGLSYVQLIN